MQQIEAVTLDAAGTLIAPARPVADTYVSMATPYGAELNTKALAAAFRTQFQAMPPMAFGELPQNEVEGRERDWWRQLVFKVTEAAGGVPDFDAYFEALYAYFGTAAAWTVYADVIPLLEGLKAREVPTAVVSNFDSRLLPVLDGLALLDAFQTVVYSTGVGTAKPDAAIFAAASTRLAVALPACIHIGDHPDADLAGARAAGMQARLIARDAGAEHEADNIINSLERVLTLLR